MNDLLKSMVRTEEAVDLFLVGGDSLALSAIPTVLEASKCLHLDVWLLLFNAPDQMPRLTGDEANALLVYSRIGSLLETVPVAGLAPILSQVRQHRSTYKQLLIRLHA